MPSGYPQFGGPIFYMIGFILFMILIASFPEHFKAILALLIIFFVVRSLLKGNKDNDNL